MPGPKVTFQKPHEEKLLEQTRTSSAPKVTFSRPKVDGVKTAIQAKEQPTIAKRMAREEALRLTKSGTLTPTAVLNQRMGVPEWKQQEDRAKALEAGAKAAEDKARTMEVDYSYAETPMSTPTPESQVLREKAAAKRQEANELRVRSTLGHRQAQGEHYTQLRQAPDFEEYAAKGAAIPSTGATTILGIGTGVKPQNEVAYAKAHAEELKPLQTGGTAAGQRASTNYLYSTMTKDEAATYYYLLAKDREQGTQKAPEFLEYMTEILNAREGERQAGELGKTPGLLRPGATALFGLGAGLDQFAQGVGQAMNAERLPTSPTQYASAKVREGLEDAGPKVLGHSLGQIGYDALTTTGNMIPSMALGAAAGPVAGAATIGMSSGGNAYNEALGQGYTKAQAASYAILNGASEAGLQYLLGGISSLGGKVSGHVLENSINNISRANLRIAAKLGRSALSEASEEYLQEILGPVFRNLALGEDNEFRLITEDAAYAALLAILTTGALEGPGAVNADRQLRQTWADMGEQGRANMDLDPSHIQVDPRLDMGERGAGQFGRVPVEESLRRVQDGTGTGVDSRIAAETGVDTPATQNPVEGVKNAPVEGVSLVDVVRKSIPQVKDMTPVAEVHGGELPEGRNVIERLTAFINRMGNKVYRAGFGDVLFSKGRIKNSMLGHGMGTAKIETFAAVPNVIQHGKQVDFQENWKGRGYDTYTFTAPVTYRGETTYMGVVVTKDVQDGRYYVHEVVDADGNLIFRGQENTAATSDGRASLSGTVDTVATTVFNDSIPQTAQDVNPESGDGGYWDSLMETAERGEAVDQGEVETEEAINARIQGAMSEWMKSLNQVNAQAEVRVDTPDDKRSLGQKARDAASSAYRQFVDSGAEIEKMGKELGDKTLYPYYNAARQSTSAAGYMLQEGGRQMSAAGEAVGPSLADIFQPIRNQGDDYYIAFQTFLYHMHNIDRMSRDNGTNISEALRQLNEFDEMMSATRPELATMPEIDLMQAAAFGDEAAQQRMELLNAYKRAKGIHNKSVFSDEVTAAKSREEAAALLRAHPEFAKLATQVYTYSDNLLQYRVDSGLVTQEFADKLRQIYPHYVPTYRVTEGQSAGGKKKGARVGKTVGRATGGNGDLMPLHMALARQTAQVVRNGTLNRMGQRILGDYDQNRQGAGKYIYKVEEAAQSLHEDTFDLLEDPTPERENTFTIYKDGKALQLTLSKGMYHAIDALMPKGSGWRSEDSYKIPAKATSLFKELTTGKNPGFLVRNFFRDFQEGMVYSESTLRWLKNFPKAYEGIVKNSADWQLFQSLGGVYSSVFDYQKGYKLEEDGKNIAQRFIGKVEAANSVIEMAPRFAEFLAYLEKHGRSQDSMMEAANRAAEITTNFGKGGEAGKFLNRTFVPFLNPGIQGANKMLKTALGRNGARACLKLWLLGAGVLGLGVRALNDLVNGDDEDYENIRDSAKDTNWLVPIGDGRYIKIPMGRDASSLGIIASRLIAMAHGDEVDWGDAANTIINQSAPSNPLKTNILAAWFDADLLDADSPGKTWYGGDIESQRLQSLAPGQRFDEDTDYFSKWLGGVLNVSPKKINYVLDQYSGVVGEYVLPLITPSKNKSIVSTFTSNFVLDGVTQNSLSSDFYSTSDKIKYAKNGGDGAMAVVSRFWGKQSDAVSDLNKALRELENDTTIPNKEKQKKIREAKAVIGGVQKNALEVLEEYEAAARKHYTGDSDVEIKRAYREANREVFGAEYALQVHDKKVYERAVAANQAGVDFDTYYKAYFATRGTDGKEMKDNQKRIVLKGMNVPDEVKIALYRDLVTDGRDEDIAAAQAAGLPFNKFLETQNKHSEINAQKGLTNNTKQAEFARWIDNQLLTVKQQAALKEAFGFYGTVRAGESKYETLTQVGWDSDTAWDVSKKLDMLLPPPGKETVTSTQKARVIVDNVSDDTKRLAALAEFVDEGTYNKLEIAYQHGVNPVVFVFYKERVEGIRAQTGRDSLTQRQAADLLRRFDVISDKERAALWQLQNTSWKPQSNPFDRSVGQKVYTLWQKRKGEAK